MRYFVSIFAFLIIGITCLAATAAEEREWTSGKHKVKATFVEMEGDTVVLRNEERKKTYRVPLAKLSPDDQAYIAKLLEAATASTDDEGGFEETSDEDEEGDDQKKSASESSKRPKGRRPEKDEDEVEVDPDEIMHSGDVGLIIPSDPSKWLNSAPITNDIRGHKAMVFVFFDQDIKRSYSKRWPKWLKIAQDYKGKPIQFIAVNSGNSRAAVQQLIQKYGISWPVIVDTDRSFEHHCNLLPISKNRPWGIRVVDGKGEFHIFNTVALRDTAITAMTGAKWRVDLKGIPNNLTRAWTNIEYGRFRAAAPEVAKALNSKKSAIKRGAKKLDEAITEYIELQVGEALYQEDEGNKFAALRIYNKLLANFEGYPLDERIQSTADELGNDPALKDEVAALKAYEAAKKLAARSRGSGRRRAISQLE